MMDVIKMTIGNSTQYCRLKLVDAPYMSAAFKAPKSVALEVGQSVEVPGLEVLQLQPRHAIRMDICATSVQIELDETFAIANHMAFHRDHSHKCVHVSSSVFKVNRLLQSLKLLAVESAGLPAMDVCRFEVFDGQSNASLADVQVEANFRRTEQWKEVEVETGEAVRLGSVLDLPEASDLYAQLSIASECSGLEVSLHDLSYSTENAVFGKSQFIAAYAEEAAQESKSAIRDIQRITAVRLNDAALLEIHVDDALTHAFTLEWEGQNVTDLSASMNTTAIQQALEGLEGIGSVEVTTEELPTRTVWRVTFLSILEESDSALTTYSPLVNITRLTPSFHILSSDGAVLSDAIDLNTTAAALEAQLTAIFKVDAVEVSSADRTHNETSWEVTFHADLSGFPLFATKAQGLGKSWTLLYSRLLA